MTLIKSPKIVGSLCFGKILENGFYEIEFGFSKKPNFIHRYFLKILLGINWKDYKEPECENTK